MDRFYADLSSDEDQDVNGHLSKLQNLFKGSNLKKYSRPPSVRHRLENTEMKPKRTRLGAIKIGTSSKRNDDT